MLAAAACVAVAAMPLPAMLQTTTECTAPVVPLCLDWDTTYSEERELDSCRNEIEEFRRESEDYEACLGQLVKQVRRMRERVPDYLECRRRGDPNCPEEPPR